MNHSGVAASCLHVACRPPCLSLLSRKQLSPNGNWSLQKTRLNFPYQLPPSESLLKPAVQLSSAPFSQLPKPLHSPSALSVPCLPLALRCHQEFLVLFHDALQLSQLFFYSRQGIFCIPSLYLQVIRIVSNAR